MQPAKLTLLLLSLTPLYAHFSLLAPASVHDFDNGGKGAPPCGDGPEPGIITTVQGGRPLQLRIREFVFHPGHYRVALSVNSRGELPADPAVAVDSTGFSISAAIQTPAKAPVLADGLFAHTAPPNGEFTTSIVLPNLNCDRCTLQVIEFMADHGFNDGGGYYYHHCADLRITADPALPPAGAEWPRAAVPTLAAFPHIASGDGWSTTFTLTNPSPSPLAVNVNELALTVAPNATVTIPAGAAEWANVRANGPISGYALYRFAPTDSPPRESTAPIQTPALTANIPFDNTTGYETAFALANSGQADTTATATIYSESGDVLTTRTILIPAAGHIDFATPGRWAETTGRRGQVRIQSSSPITALALCFTSSGAFFSLPVN